MVFIILLSFVKHCVHLFYEVSTTDGVPIGVLGHKGHPGHPFSEMVGAGLSQAISGQCNTSYSHIGFCKHFGQVGHPSALYWGIVPPGQTSLGQNFGGVHTGLVEDVSSAADGLNREPYNIKKKLEKYM